MVVGAAAGAMCSLGLVVRIRLCGPRPPERPTSELKYLKYPAKPVKLLKYPVHPFLGVSKLGNSA